MFVSDFGSKCKSSSHCESSHRGIYLAEPRNSFKNQGIILTPRVAVELRLGSVDHSTILWVFRETRIGTERAVACSKCGARHR